MASIYHSLATIALLPVLLAAGWLTKRPAYAWAGLALLGAVTAAAAGLAVHAAASDRWADLPVTALALLAIAIDWDMTLARRARRLPRLTMWLIGYRLGSSTGSQRPHSRR